MRFFSSSLSLPSVLPFVLSFLSSLPQTVTDLPSSLHPPTPRSIRNAAGPSTKSSLSHTFTHDTRDDPFLSTRGAFLKLKQEYAGLGGDANFVKMEGEASVTRPFAAPTTTTRDGTETREGWARWSYSLSARSGLLVPFGSPYSSASSSSPTTTPTSSLFSDRFHLGGPTSVRSFLPNSLGPRDNTDYLGGDAFYALGASVLAPLPLGLGGEWGRSKRGAWWEENMRVHGWVNAGKLVGSGELLFLSFIPLLRH